MNVVLYMAMTANGMIATLDDDTSWVTKTEWESFSGMIKKHGNMVLGRRTYEIMVKNDEFAKSKLDKIKTVVVTHKPLKAHNQKSVSAVNSSMANSPQEALAILKKEGYKTAMICGGGGLNTSFMKERLVDEIYLDLEPIIFGRGIRLFAEADFETKLKLIGTKKLSEHEIQLHYGVRR